MVENLSRPTITEIPASKEEEERWTGHSREIVENCKEFIGTRKQSRNGPIETRFYF